MNVQNILTEKQRTGFKMLFEKTDATALMGGSRSGKTFDIIMARVCMCMAMKSRHLTLRKHLSTLISSVWFDTYPKVLDILEIPARAYKFKGDRYFIKYANGSEDWFGGLDSHQRSDKILGNEYTTIWVNEASEFDADIIPVLRTRLAENSGFHNKLWLDFNPPETSHWTYDLVMEKKLNGETININSLLMNPKDNQQNLPEHYLRMLQTLPERQRKRFFDGEFVSPEESLFKPTHIKLRYDLPKTYSKTIIAIDPAATNKSTSDETGIVVVSRLHDVGFVKEDLSMRGSPEQWARAAILAYLKYKKISNNCKIVAEVNQGGDMVYSVLAKVAKDMGVEIEYEAVRTAVSKMYRAEEFSVMLATGEWYFDANFTFDLLVRQLLGYTNVIENKKSPDRVDALIIGASQLFTDRKVLYFTV